MTIIELIDACITDMQAICNSNGDQDTVEEIAVHVADELAIAKQAATDLLEACQAVQHWGLKGQMPDGRWAFDLLAPAIAKATVSPMP